MVVYNNVSEIEEYQENLFEIENESPPLLSIEENFHQNISQYPLTDSEIPSAFYDDSKDDPNFYVNEPSVSEKQIKDHPLQCKYCGKGFKHLSKLFEHETKHTGEKNYSCEYCDAKFSNASSVRIHHRSHTGELPYVCSWGCGRKFKSSSALRMHERSHSGERNHQCHICLNAFPRKTHLSRHLKAVHKVVTIREKLEENLQKLINASPPPSLLLPENYILFLQEVVQEIHFDAMKRKSDEAFSYNENSIKVMI